MKIKEKTVCVYDIEVFPNVFHCTVKNTETGQYYLFEVSERKNNITDLIAFFKYSQDKLMCGYNNIHYDNPIINFILDYESAMSVSNYQKICRNIYTLSNIIVQDEDREIWKKWKYADNFATLDLLTMLFSQKLRVGLKEMQVTMRYKNVQEYEGDFTKPLPVSDIDEMIKYNINDVDSTEELLNRCKDKIELRIGIEKEYGVDVLSKDGMTIGTEILKLKYLEKTGKSWYDIKDLRSPCDIIDLNKIIFPFIKFETPVLQQLLNEMKQQKVGADRKSFEKHFLLGDLEVSVGVGGIHSVNEPETIIPKEDEYLLDSDANSLYPSLIISYGLVPKHLGKEFLEIYGKVREERLEAKRNKQQIKNETLKLSLNGATGNYQNQYSWLYDPEAVMKIRINGQLLLLMLTEKLMKVGANIKQLNTDGILYTIPKSVDYQSVLKEWEDITKLTLETEEFEAFYQYAINDYLAIGKGYKETKNPKLLKKKGLFIDEVSLGKGMQPMIIPKAINEYFANGTPVEQTIKGCKDLNMFITYQKVGKDFSVEYNNKLITHINRYYVSTNAPYLYKCKVTKKDYSETWCTFLYGSNNESRECPAYELDVNGKYWYNPDVHLDSVKYFTKIISKGIRSNYINLLTASGVRIVNNFEEIKEFPTDVNYKYYIKEAMKIITSFTQQQLKLF